MKKLIYYFSFAFLTSFTTITESPSIAGGCSSQINKTAEINCPKDDIDCQTEKAKKFYYKKSVKS